MKTTSIFRRATAILKGYRADVIRRRDAAKVENLPAYLLKDIGWPASQSDCCTDRAR